MAVYIVSKVSVHDAEKMAAYVEAAPETVEKYGGRYIIRTGSIQQVEGERDCNRAVILEFPDREAALAWYNSDDYKPLRDDRWAASDASIVLLE